MRVVSVNVGLPRELSWKNRVVETGIFKPAVEGRISVGKLNLEGDGQADLSVHGGPTKAVYVYPSEHYDYWRCQLPEVEFSWGMFGENLTTEGLFEDRVYIGDSFRIGSADFRVTEPRMPCYKLGLRFNRDDMVKLFLLSTRSGFYLSVVSEGDICAGDSIQPLTTNSEGVSVADIFRLQVSEKANL